MMLPFDIPERILRVVCLRMSFNPPRGLLGWVSLVPCEYSKPSWPTFEPKAFLVCPYRRGQIPRQGKAEVSGARGVLASCPVITNRAPWFFHGWWCTRNGRILRFISSPRELEAFRKRPFLAYVLMKVPVAAMRCSDRWRRNEVPNNFQPCTKLNHPAARLHFWSWKWMYCISEIHRA